VADEPTTQLIRVDLGGSLADAHAAEEDLRALLIDAGFEVVDSYRRAPRRRGRQAALIIKGDAGIRHLFFEVFVATTAGAGGTVAGNLLTGPSRSAIRKVLKRWHAKHPGVQMRGPDDLIPKRK
jgi:hypothetical protein